MHDGHFDCTYIATIEYMCRQQNRRNPTVVTHRLARLQPNLSLHELVWSARIAYRRTKLQTQQQPHKKRNNKAMQWIVTRSPQA